MKRKFWNWIRNEDTGERILFLNGEISDETWFGDEVTPGLFRSELNNCQGDITVWINSPGGDCFAAAQIYNMLMNYTGNINVKIDGIAASAASVIAMAGTHVSMSPVAMLMIHNPATISAGDVHDMERAKVMLSEVKESIINAYELKTGISRQKLSNMMDAETWFNARKAVELGFADEILFSKQEENDEKGEDIEAVMFSRQTVTNSLISKLCFITEPEKEKAKEAVAAAPEQKKKIAVESLKKRLNLIA